MSEERIVCTDCGKEIPNEWITIAETQGGNPIKIRACQAAHICGDCLKESVERIKELIYEN